MGVFSHIETSQHTYTHHFLFFFQFINTGCQSTEFINKTDAKERFLVTEKQLAAAKYVPKPWYGKQSYLYLESTIEQLSLERWGSERALKEAKSERKPRNKTPRDFWHKFYDPFFYEYFDDHRYILPPYFGPPATSAQTNAITVHHPAANVTVSKTTDTAGVITFGNVSVNISIGAPNPTSGVSHHNHQAVVGSGSGSGPGSSSGPAGAQGYVAVNGGGAYFSLSVNVAGGW
ncbi:hypothetical protein BC936DRAFT_141485 [Jimgerdemannia flammicorona]|uniref:Uncharacterized protein n=1 Tax=Jimgerdemannia flammicorona TaxID=994334 RepID=A0A433A254_9FUNG|nr:hypothetical protein BC936DRAFT_141485 [Jimgerdemannia flammicorona]